MNNISIIRLLVLIPLLAQGAPDDPPPSSSTSRVQGAWPWVLGAAAVGVACKWTYDLVLLSPEERLKQATLNIHHCMTRNKDNSIHQYGFPTACEDSFIRFTLARDALSAPQGAPTTQALINSLKEK